MVPSFKILLLALSLAGFCSSACTGTLDEDPGSSPPDETAPMPTNNANNTNNTNNANNTNNSNNANNSNPDNSNPNNANNSNPNNVNNTNNVGPDPCEMVTCGTQAQCVEGACECNQGFVGDPTVECTPADPCANVDCSYGASCAQGVCSCDPGFDDDGSGGCVQQTPGDTAARTAQEVCDRWAQDFPTQATQTFQVDPIDTCDPGVIHPDVQQDALRRVSLHRWLVGLGPVTSLQSQMLNVQSCATTLAAESAGLTHNIPMSYACYSSEAAAGAGSSNLAFGVSNPASSVDLYIRDLGVRSLGHRRWIFNPRMGATAFGQRGSYSCMYSFDSSASSDADFVAYPAPGPYPSAALGGHWSFGSTKHGLTNATVEMTRVSDGSAVEVNDVYTPGGNYGIRVVAWQPVNFENDVEYEITIDNLTGQNGTSVTYRTQVVSCN